MLDGFRTAGGKWPAPVIVASVAAAVAMLSTAAVSVLAGDHVAATSDLYGRRPLSSGKRCVRAATSPTTAPSPDTCVVRTGPLPLLTPPHTPQITESVPPPRILRPLHDATVEVPDNFI
ncbi:MAG: hypothetical protein K2X91_09810 [Thermoleophilia bacterium]|nr:hypothetical protein [Thermoleophilia bacterium]